jgi:hypothetical protein
VKKQKQLIENRTLFFNLIAETTTTLDDCNANGGENNKQQATNLFTKYENEIRTNVNEFIILLTNQVSERFKKYFFVLK